jgi:Cu-Zn family superoxide dismutase
MKLRKWLIGLSLCSIVSVLHAEVCVSMYSTQPDHKKLGDVIFQNKGTGLEILPDLTGLPPGKHGFHLHDHASCDAHGDAAGGHYDPEMTSKHLGPNGKGHKGDLPVLVVNKEGVANKPLFAPHLTEKDLIGHALMIHEGGDNYSDTPKPLGGGGARIACGVIAESNIVPDKTVDGLKK